MPVLEAFWQWMLRPRGLLDEQPVSEGLVAIARVIEQSPALRAREQQVFERYTESLADLLATDTGAQRGAIEPWVAANAVMGLHRALVHHARGRVLAGARNPELAHDLRARAEEARAMLAARGLRAQGPAGVGLTPRSGRGPRAGSAASRPRTLSCCTDHCCRRGREAEERPAVALVEDDDLAALDTALDELARAAAPSATTSWRLFIEPGSIARCGGRSPNTIEQPEPGGVSCTTCMCSFFVS